MCICFLSFFFFWLIHSRFFSRFFCFPFSLPFFSLYLLPFIPFLSTGNVLASALLKTWKSNNDQLGDLAYLPPTLHPKLDTFFLAFFLYTRMDGSVLAVLAAYQNNLVTSKVVQCLPTKTARKYDSRWVVLRYSVQIEPGETGRNHMSSGPLLEVKNSRKVQNVSPKRGRLREVVAQGGSTVLLFMQIAKPVNFHSSFEK